MTKYRAVPTVVNGIRFASKKEAKTYQDLLLLQKAGKIKNLELQPKFKFEVIYYRADSRKNTFSKVLKYVGDFLYQEGENVIVHDSKGYETKEFKLKKKLMEALYPEYVLRIT